MERDEYFVMPRRALRKNDSTVDLSRHLREVTQLLPAEPGIVPERLDPQAFFSRPAPLEIEMGSGKGLFLLNAAMAHPERNYLGIEVAAKYAEFCALRLARQEVTNGFMLSGDGLRFFHELLPDACAAAVHVYFPDPWWKKRHRKRRVLNAPFAKDIQRVLIPGGALHFWTDVEEYYLSTLELLAAETTLSGPLSVPEQTPAHDMDYRTNFERRKRQDGLPIYRSEYRKA
jgi:tRNA (guanine-N7-)-methyltransferase